MRALVLMLGLLPQAALAQGDLTQAPGVATIHQAIQGQMVAFKQEGDVDFVYFTNLLAWRCGVAQILVGLNGAPPTIPYPMEPCHRDLAQPNTLKMEDPAFPIYLKMPAGSAQTMTLRIVYEDGKTADFVVERAKSLMY
ncbi:MAG: hypothetical protein ACT4OK_13075 [Gemmobacter sp.]